MAKQKYAIRQISALGIISASRRENGDRRFFFDAADSSKEYTVEKTKRDDCEYAVFPAANFNACRVPTAFSKKSFLSSRGPSSTARNAAGFAGRR